MKRKYFGNDYGECGLRMIDPYAFSLAQKNVFGQTPFG